MGVTVSHSSLVWNQPANQFHHSDSGWQLLFRRLTGNAKLSTALNYFNDEPK